MTTVISMASPCDFSTWLEDADFIWAKKLRKLLEQELPEIDGRSREELFKTWSQNTMFCDMADMADMADTVFTNFENLKI